MTRLGPAALASLALAACADTTILGSDYDQSCDEATDCRAVLVGDVCACPCGGDAINARDEQRYEADYAAKQRDLCGEVTCGPCRILPPPSCKNKRCSLD